METLENLVIHGMSDRQHYRLLAALKVTEQGFRDASCMVPVDSVSCSVSYTLVSAASVGINPLGVLRIVETWYEFPFERHLFAFSSPYEPPWDLACDPQHSWYIFHVLPFFVDLHLLASSWCKPWAIPKADVRHPRFRYHIWGTSGPSHSFGALSTG